MTDIRVVIISIACFVCCPLLFAQKYNVAITEGTSSAQFLDVAFNGHVESVLFDTGASYVSLSKSKRDEFLANGVISQSDFTGYHGYIMTASDDNVPYDELYIREIKIGDAVFHDVQAIVILGSSSDNKILLGQSVIGRFDSYNIKGNTLSFDTKSDEEQEFLIAKGKAFRLIFDEDNRDYNAIINLLRPYIQTESFKNLSDNDHEVLLSSYAYSCYNMKLDEEATSSFYSLYKRYGTTEYLIRYASSLYYMEKYDEAELYLQKAIATENEDIAECLFMLINIYFDDKDKFSDYGRRLIDVMLKKEGVTEEQLFSERHSIKYIGLIYYRLAIIERNQWNCELGYKYKTISENLGFQPKKKE